MRKISKVYFYLLDIKANSSPELISKNTLEGLKRDKRIDIAGYATDEALTFDLTNRIGSTTKSIRFDSLKRGEVEQSIQSTLKKCCDILHLPYVPLHIFVFPWLIEERIRSIFGGVNAFAVHESVMHLFIAPRFSKRSLIETTAHEFCHHALYQSQRKKNYTLIDHILMEGLSENFREDAVGGKAAPWSIALTRKEAIRTLQLLRGSLYSKNKGLRNDILFGSHTYKRWAGYSIGYWTIKEFRKKYPEISWDSLIKMKSREIITKSGLLSD